MTQSNNKLWKIAAVRGCFFLSFFLPGAVEERFYKNLIAFKILNEFEARFMAIVDQ